MEFDVQVKLVIYRQFAETGARPAVGDTAERVGADVETVLDAYRRLAAQRLLVLEDDGSSIRMASPFLRKLLTRSFRGNSTVITWAFNSRR